MSNPQARFLPVDQIPQDFNDSEIKILFNPLDEDFTFSFAGKNITIKANEERSYPYHVAAHGAKHLAKKIIHDNLVSYLQNKFVGEDEHGRAKWKMQSLIYSSKEDVIKLRDQLLFDPETIGGKERAEISIPSPTNDIPKVSEPIVKDSGLAPTIENTLNEVKKRKMEKKEKKEKALE